jgi:hypothetical protein
MYDITIMDTTCALCFTIACIGFAIGLPCTLANNILGNDKMTRDGLALVVKSNVFVCMFTAKCIR